MRVATGRVIEGRVVVEGEPLDEGATVTVLAPDDDGAFDLSPEQETELHRALAEADRGEGIDSEDLLGQIDR